MCLVIVDQRFDPPKEGERIAYKIFALLPNGILLNQYQGGGPKLGKWNTAPKKFTKENKLLGRPHYQLGFHAYATEEAAKFKCPPRFIVVPVLLRDITTIGRQSSCKVVVARKMLVLYTPPKSEQTMEVVQG